MTTPFARDRFTWLAYFMLAYYAYLQAVLGPLMPFLRSELNLSYTVGGLHFSAFAVGMILAGLVGDRVAGRWGRRFTFWGGAAGMGLGALAFGLSRQPSLTIASAFVMGLLGSLLLVMIQATLSDRHGEQRATALTEANVAAMICAGLAPLFVGGFQRAGIGWRGALFVALPAVVLLAARLWREPVPAGHQSVAGPASAGGRLPARYWAYWTVIVLGVSIEWSMVAWGAEFLETVVALSKSTASAMMSVFFLAMVIGRAAGSRLTHVMQSPTLLLIAVGIAAVGFPIFWLASPALLNVAGLFVAGLGIANLFPLTLSVATNVAPQQSDAASARVSLGAGIAILVAPLTLGWLADHLTLQTAYGSVAILLVTAVGVILAANRLASRRMPARL